LAQLAAHRCDALARPVGLRASPARPPVSDVDSRSPERSSGPPGRAGSGLPCVRWPGGRRFARCFPVFITGHASTRAPASS
jgi:hypothetical protein